MGGNRLTDTMINVRDRIDRFIDGNVRAEDLVILDIAYMAGVESAGMSVADMAASASMHAVRCKLWNDNTTLVKACDRLQLEVDEMKAEAVNDDDVGLKIDESGKPIGFTSELADVVIMAGSIAGTFGIDLEAAIRMKMKYNETRGVGHKEAAK